MTVTTDQARHRGPFTGIAPGHAELIAAARRIRPRLIERAPEAERQTTHLRRNDGGTPRPVLSALLRPRELGRRGWQPLGPDRDRRRTGQGLPVDGLGVHAHRRHHRLHRGIPAARGCRADLQLGPASRRVWRQRHDRKRNARRRGLPADRFVGLGQRMPALRLVQRRRTGGRRRRRRDRRATVLPAPGRRHDQGHLVRGRNVRHRVEHRRRRRSVRPPSTSPSASASVRSTTVTSSPTPTCSTECRSPRSSASG